MRAAEILGISRTYLYELLKKESPDRDPDGQSSGPDEEAKRLAPTPEKVV